MGAAESATARTTVTAAADVTVRRAVTTAEDAAVTMTVMPAVAASVMKSGFTGGSSGRAAVTAAAVEETRSVTAVGSGIVRRAAPLGCVMSGWMAATGDLRSPFPKRRGNKTG